MRVWDINPGYLSNQNLLGEHVEIHAVFSVIHNNKKGYSNHPETKRWLLNLNGLKSRHDLVVSEMNIRGYEHKSPLNSKKRGKYPDTFIDIPYEQLNILKNKYILKSNYSARIPIPKNIQELWAQHKYSILAREPKRYKEIGKKLAVSNEISADDLLLEFVKLLRTKPQKSKLKNAIDHMWGYVSKYSEGSDPGSLKIRFEKIIKLSIEKKITYLLNSTALSDFNTWL